MQANQALLQTLLYKGMQFEEKTKEMAQKQEDCTPAHFWQFSLHLVSRAQPTRIHCLIIQLLDRTFECLYMRVPSLWLCPFHYYHSAQQTGCDRLLNFFLPQCLQAAQDSFLCTQVSQLLFAPGPETWIIRHSRHCGVCVIPTLQPHSSY